jgi:hypothetical protein
MNFYTDYEDWIYIALVLLAFFVFLAWNYSKQKPAVRGGRRNFKERLRDKRKS